MWQKRAEFSLWLLEVKDKNLEELSGWVSPSESRTLEGRSRKSVWGILQD